MTKEEFDKLNHKICRLRKMITYRFVQIDNEFIVEFDGLLIHYTNQEFRDLFFQVEESKNKNNPILDEMREVRSVE